MRESGLPHRGLVNTSHLLQQICKNSLLSHIHRQRHRRLLGHEGSGDRTTKYWTSFHRPFIIVGAIKSARSRRRRTSTFGSKAAFSQDWGIDWAHLLFGVHSFLCSFTDAGELGLCFLLSGNFDCTRKQECLGQKEHDLVPFLGAISYSPY